MLISYLLSFMLSFSFNNQTLTYPPNVNGEYVEIVNVNYIPAVNETYAVMVRYGVDHNQATGKVLQARSLPGHAQKSDFAKGVVVLPDSGIQVLGK